MQTLVASARSQPPRLALVLGSGLSRVAERLTDVISTSYAEIPGLPAPTVAGHAGRLYLGAWGAIRVLIFGGRFHLYEGHPRTILTRLVEIAQELGAKAVLLTNAAGGIHPALGPGRLMAIRDHIEWTSPSGWRQPRQRPSPYSPRLLGLLRQAAAAEGIPLLEGVYLQVTGPCYETPAEIRAMRSVGADAVGMSTAIEANAARALGMEVAGLSMIANQAAGLSAAPLNHQEVLAATADMTAMVTRLLDRFVALV